MKTPVHVMRAGRFAWERGLRGAPLALPTRGVLFALATYMDGDGSGARPTQQQLADDCGVDERTVKRHLRLARDAGFLRRDGVSHEGRVAPYVAVLPEGDSTTPPLFELEGDTTPPPLKAEGDSPVPRGGQPVPKRGTAQAPPPDQDQTKTKNTRAAAQPAPAETEGQRVNRLAKTYTDAVPLSAFQAVAGVVRKALGSYSDDAIAAALSRLAADRRSVTANTLRIELEGRPRTVGNFGVSYGDDSRALPARTMTGDEWIAESRTLRSNQDSGTHRGGTR